jgi:ribosome-associated protein
MKVSVKKKDSAIPVVIETEFIKLEAAMKLSHAFSGGTAKAIIQDGEVAVNGEVCTMRGKKLYPGDRFCYDGQEYLICTHGIK